MCSHGYLNIRAFLSFVRIPGFRLMGTMLQVESSMKTTRGEGSA
jgi:hypothetical protein